MKNNEFVAKWFLVTFGILVGSLIMCLAFVHFGKGLNESVKKAQIDQNKRILLNVGRAGSMIELTNGAVRMLCSIDPTNNIATLLAPDRTRRVLEIDSLAHEMKTMAEEYAYGTYAYLSHRFLVELSTNQPTSLP